MGSSIPCSLIDSLFEALEVRDKELSHSLEVGVILFLVHPVVAWVQNFGVDTIDLGRHLHPEDWHLNKVGLLKRSIMNSIDNLAGVGDTNTLR
jgi:hypothetical protein